MYVHSTVFYVHGDRVNKTKELYGYTQRSSAPYGDSELKFVYQDKGFPRFTSNAVNLLSNDCIDLYKEANKSEASYIATYCFKNTVAETGKKNAMAYSYYGNPILYFDYNGQNPTTVQWLTTAFDRSKRSMARVNYLNIDAESKLSDFANVKYVIQRVGPNNDDDDYNKTCMLGEKWPKKYIKQTEGPRPEGGSNYEIKSYAANGGCAFEYNHSFLLTRYLSLYREGGIIPTPTPTATPTPIVKPTNTPSITAIPVVTKLPIPKITPEPKTTKSETCKELYTKYCLKYSKHCANVKEFCKNVKW
jgi:hypothetical protein